MLASNTGRPYRVAVYQDRKDSADIEKPLGFRVVTSSLSVCGNPSDHHVFFWQLLFIVGSCENSI